MDDATPRHARRAAPRGSAGRTALLVLGIWTVPAVIGTTARLVQGTLHGRGEPWEALLVGALPWYTWAVLTPVVLFAARLWPVVQPLSAGSAPSASSWLNPRSSRESLA